MMTYVDMKMMPSLQQINETLREKTNQLLRFINQTTSFLGWNSQRIASRVMLYP